MKLDGANDATGDFFSLFFFLHGGRVPLTEWKMTDGWLHVDGVKNEKEKKHGNF